MQPGTSERSPVWPADEARDRRQTIGTMLILVGILFALAGTGLAASAYLRAVDDPEAQRDLMTSLLGTVAPLQFLIGTGAAVLGAVALFFGLLLRSIDGRPVPRLGVSTHDHGSQRADPLRERRVRWGAMGAMVALFAVSILSAVALSPEVLLDATSEDLEAVEDEPLYEDVWQGAAATSPTAHLQERLSRESGALWTVPAAATRASVNVTWSPVDADATVLRVVVQEPRGDGWVTLGSRQGPSSLVLDVPVDAEDRLRVVVERATSDETRQPFVLHVSFWAE